jgi:hypothetical protein
MATSLFDLSRLRQHLVFLSQILVDPECVHSDLAPGQPWEFTLFPGPCWPTIYYVAVEVDDRTVRKEWNPPKWWVAFCEALNKSAGHQLIDPNLEPCPGWKIFGAVALVTAHLTKSEFDQANELDRTLKRMLHDLINVLMTYRKWHELVMCDPITTRAFGQLLNDTLAFIRSGEGQSTVLCTTSISEQPNGKKRSEGRTVPSDRKPDGPFDSDGFRYGGTEVRFGRAALPLQLVLALWDTPNHRPRESRPIGDVQHEVWGVDDVEDSTYRQLCTDVRGRFEIAGCPLNIENLQGKVRLIPRLL